MGFSSNNVAEVLLMYDNDTDKALAHFLNNASWNKFACNTNTWNLWVLSTLLNRFSCKELFVKILYGCIGTCFE